MELLSNLAIGFTVAFTFTNLLYAFFGVLLAALAVGVFVISLQLQLPIWPLQQ